MSDFAAELEETRRIHRLSDLTNLANTHLTLTEFRLEINELIDEMVAEVEGLAKVEWPREGLIFCLYERVHDTTRGVFDAIHNAELKARKRQRIEFGNEPD